MVSRHDGRFTNELARPPLAIQPTALAQKDQSAKWMKGMDRS